MKSVGVGDMAGAGQRARVQGDATVVGGRYRATCQADADCGRK